MKRKYLISFTIALSLVFSFSVCFANNDGLGTAANEVKNFVGGVENTVENAAKDVSNVSKDATGTLENDMNHHTNMSSSNHLSNVMSSGTSKVTGTNNYSAKKTSTDDNTRIMGMTANAWTWLIIGIAAIAIIAVVWYYSMQFTNTNRHNDDD